VFSATGLPAGLSINAATGLVSGTIQPAAAASYSATVTVSDGTLNASAIVPWTISDPAAGPVNGLKAEYYAGEQFGTLKLTRTDPAITFFWPETTAPAPGLPGDYFSVRWTGTLKPPVSGNWQFFADADDGIRVWIDGQLVIDKWDPPPSVYYDLTGPAISLTGGQNHALRVEYQDFFSDGLVVLKWQGPGQPRQPVPTSALFLPTAGPDPVAAAVADLPRLLASVRLEPAPGGMLDLVFARKPALSGHIVLEGTDDFAHWHAIADSGWSGVPQPDGTELVRIPHACCLMSGHRTDQVFFRFRVGP
jgi:hypothetical protein